MRSFRFRGPHVRRLIVAGFSIAAGNVCAHAAEAIYRCSDGTVVAAAFSEKADGNSVALAMEGAAMVLAQVDAADGARYSDGKAEFWIKGQSATFTMAGRTLTCQVTK